jgi:hypothetical protein
MAYDPKINRAKGIEFGTLAGVASVLTSMLIILLDRIPSLTDGEVQTLASGMAFLFCTGAAFIYKTMTNKAKHS